MIGSYLQESNLTARQSRREPHRVIHLIYDLTNAALRMKDKSTLRRIRGAYSDPPAPHAKMLSTIYGSPSIRESLC